MLVHYFTHVPLTLGSWSIDSVIGVGRELRRGLLTKTGDDKVDVTQGMYCGMALTEGLPYLGHLDNHFISLSELAREPRLARNGFGPDRLAVQRLQF